MLCGLPAEDYPTSLRIGDHASGLLCKGDVWSLSPPCCDACLPSQEATESCIASAANVHS